jgi:SAM-dependent methyltransferase
MRALPFPACSFGAAVSLFTSFGYFETADEDAAVLAEVARVLQPGGRFVLDYLNPGPTIAHLIPSSQRTVGRRRVAERRWIDPAGPFLRKEITVLEEGADVVRYDERVRLYAPAELEEALRVEGLGTRTRWGSYSGEPFDPGRSLRVILLADRETERGRC